MSNVVIYVIGFVALLVWVLQVVALADPAAYITGKYFSCGCGMFECCNGGSIFNDGCRDRRDHAKAAAAFGVLAVLMMSVSMIVHIMLCFGKTTGMLLSNSIGSKLVNYMWVWHLVTALFEGITWAILAGLYDRSLCNGKFKYQWDLNFGFFFLVINFVIELVLAYCCWRGMHVGGYSGGGGGGGGHRHHRGPPPGYYESNPIDRQGFQRRY